MPGTGATKRLLGKAVGSDAREGKRTYAALLGIEGARLRAAELRALLWERARPAVLKRNPAEAFRPKNEGRRPGKPQCRARSKRSRNFSSLLRLKLKKRLELSGKNRGAGQERIFVERTI